MALEIERRFLVVGEQWRHHCLWRAHLRQGYLSRPQDALTLRVRISGRQEVGGGAGHGGGEAWLTLKAPPRAIDLASGVAAETRPMAPGEAPDSALTRLEFEYPIPLEDAEALLSLTRQQLSKTRYGLDLPGGDWVLDVFEGANAPLVLAEVELDQVAATPAIPSWCVRELTGLRPLSNASLAALPLERWSAEQRLALLGEGWPVNPPAQA